MKKHRDEAGLFVAEGPKLVGELLTKFKCRYMAVTDETLFSSEGSGIERDVVTCEELKRASLLTTAHEVLAVFEKPKCADSEKVSSLVGKELCLALDDIQDPGNLGTIIRTADWFGIEHIFCSKDTADVFSPKALQATMGSAARVNLIYCDLTELIRSFDGSIPVYGTFLKGDNIYSSDLEQRGLVVIGNEGNGISSEVEELVTKRLCIASYPSGRKTVESLNASIATAVTCAEFRRRAKK